MSAEHLHLAFNHIPFLGAAFAILPILLGLLLKNKALLLTGLGLAALTGWVTPVVMDTGERAYERYEEQPGRHFLDANFYESLELHEHRAHDWSKVMYASAAAATLAFGLMVWKERIGRWAAWVALVLCVASTGSGIWIAESGGKIRRPDFRMEMSGAKLPDAERHEED